MEVSFIGICLDKKVKTVMVSNSTNINKMNSHLSHQIIEHKKHMALEIQVLAWYRHKNVGWLNIYKNCIDLLPLKKTEHCSKNE